MKHVIEGKELLPLVHNALRAEVDENGFLHCCRFSDFQLEQYELAGRRLDFDYVPRTRPASNVTLDFVTDSDILGLIYTWEPVITPYLSFDLLVDGVLWDSMYTEAQNNELKGFSLPEGRHRVTLVFPWSVEFRLKTLVLGDGASLQTIGDGLNPERESDAPEYRKNTRILAFGDSITQGYYSRHPSFCYVGSMTGEMNAECLNQAIGGFVFDRSVIDPALAEWKPDIITVAYGTNDYSFSSSAEQIREDMTGFMDKLTELFPDVKILGIMPVYRNDSNQHARLFIKDYTPAQAHQVIREVYGHYPQVTVLEDTYFPRTPDCFSPDYLHPNDLGFQFYARAVVGRLRSM